MTTPAVIPSVETVAVELIDGRVCTTSNQIADHFRKQHKDVLRAIDNLDCSPEYHARNFAPMSLPVELGNGAVRLDRAYRITRDGFTFLAMGFRGKRAAAWKEAYITAFNAMERQLVAKPADKPNFSLMEKRWLVYFDCNGVECAKLIPTEAAIIIPDEIQDLIAYPSIVSERQLANIVQACATRLKAASDQRRREAQYGGQ